MDKPFYLGGLNNSSSLDTDIHQFKQIQVSVGVDYGAADLRLELYEGGEFVGDLDLLHPSALDNPDPSFSPPLTDERRHEASVKPSRVHDAPGRTLRVWVTAPGHTVWGPDRQSDGRANPRIVPQTVSVVIYGTAG